MGCWHVTPYGKPSATSRGWQIPVYVVLVVVPPQQMHLHESLHSVLSEPAGGVLK